MHRLVQCAVRDHAWENGTLGTAISAAAERLNFITKLSMQHVWRDRGSLSTNAQHVEAVWHAVRELEARDTPAWGQIAEPVLDLRLWVLRHLNTISDVARAVGWGQVLVADCERVLGPEHATTLNSRSGLAYSYDLAGRKSEAISLSESTLALRARVQGENHLDTVVSRTALASIYWSVGRVQEAIVLYEQTSTDRARTLGEDHPRTLTLRSHLAGAYRRAGRVEDAITLHTRNLTVREREFGANHPDTAREQYRLARAYETAGQRQWAEVL
ncbi:tetratricopeptide repeat protein [Streptosporangium subroseum]|uniref:tetratricopeptide repeat protein n=1 Tax=Streptosporangium subroseum TaxID=106412 RepID=UPI00341C69C7